ncbi:NAD(P)-dependent oxidoreductase [candidate division KSB1 bacterium]|nr:NAD(P)-dependent oxidoreductase [candidate division KSB1 bacterium]
MKALVTGSNGFIGSTLVEKLFEQGFSVRCMIRKTSNLRWLENLDVEFYYGDMRDPESLTHAVKDIGIVFHLAGVTKARSESGYIEGNYQGTLNLLNACRKSGASEVKFIFVSSQAAGGPGSPGKPKTEFDPPQPISLYGKSKLMAEKVVLDFAGAFPVCIIRPPSVYGPRDKDVFVLFKNIYKGFAPVLGSGKQTASMVYVYDLIDGILLTAKSPSATGKTFYLSGDGDYNWLSISKQIASALNKKPVTIHVPYFMLDIVSFFSTAAAVMNKKPALLNGDKVRELKQASWLCSNRRAKDELGFDPKFSLQDGLTATAEWYKKTGWL